MVSPSRRNTPLNREELRAIDCFDNVYQYLNTHLELPVRKSKIKKQVLHSLIAMSSERLSVHSIQPMDNVLSETSMRHHLSKFSIQELENIAAGLLMHPLDLLTEGKKYDFVIDITLDPYYGCQRRSRNPQLRRNKSPHPT